MGSRATDETGSLLSLSPLGFFLLPLSSPSSLVLPAVGTREGNKESATDPRFPLTSFPFAPSHVDLPFSRPGPRTPPLPSPAPLFLSFSTVVCGWLPFSLLVMPPTQSGRRLPSWSRCRESS